MEYLTNLDEKILDSKSIISAFMENIDSMTISGQSRETQSAIRTSLDVLAEWKEILFSIRPEDNGKLLYYRSQLIDVKNGSLIITTDHPGYIQLFQLHKTYILTGFQKKFPDLKITKLVCKAKG
ncbi:MAG: hypothetical protein Ta2A_13080 [Treponemataceae bacterium]|nr:MAG: hypothetical protein Ta2A_13080 [Treponemataceae bacterium]